MPTVEALLCELPVIAPDSTGFKEYLTTENSCPLKTKSVRVLEVWENRYFIGKSWSRTYGMPEEDKRYEGNPNTTMEVPSVEEAVEAMKMVVSKQSDVHNKAKQGRLDILREFNWENAVKGVNEIIEKGEKQ